MKKDRRKKGRRKYNLLHGRPGDRRKLDHSKTTDRRKKWK